MPASAESEERIDPFINPRDESPIYLTRDQPGVGGVIKQRNEDFLVEEQPAIQPDGEGAFLHLFIEKHGLTTQQLVSELARSFDLDRKRISFAGLKDKNAITRQVISIDMGERTFEDFQTIDAEGVRVLWADTHSARITRGDLLANRFSIRIRDVAIAKAPAAHRSLRMLEAHGVPNRFGAQRFGVRRNNHLVGRAILMNDDEQAIRALLCAPIVPAEDPLGVDARTACDKEDYKKAADLIGRGFETEHRVCAHLAAGRTAEDALRDVRENIRNLWVSAFQSALFNSLLDAELEIVARDESRMEELTRRDGPLWGVKLKQPDRDAGDRERAALEQTGVTLESMREATKRWRLRVTGDRRSWLAPVQDTDIEAGADEHGEYIRCAFELPPGAFATSVMHEIMKPVCVANQQDAAKEDAPCPSR